MKKKRAPYGAIVLRGLIFKLGVRTVPGTLVKVNGVTCFTAPQEDIFSMLPFCLDDEMCNCKVDAWIRTYDSSVLLQLGVDDLLLEDLDKDKRYFDVQDLAPLQELYERGLVRAVPALLNCLTYAKWTSLVCIVCLLLKLSLFPFVVVPAMLALYLLQWAIRDYKLLNNMVIYDAVGNWINLSNGVTSLNEGTFQFEVKRE